MTIKRLDKMAAYTTIPVLGIVAPTSNFIATLTSQLQSIVGRVHKQGTRQKRERRSALSASRPVDAFELVDVYLQHASGGALMVNGDKNLDAVTEWALRSIVQSSTTTTAIPTKRRPYLQCSLGNNATLLIDTKRDTIVYSRRGFRTQRSSIGIGQIDPSKDKAKTADGSKTEATNTEVIDKLRKEANEKDANHPSLIDRAYSHGLLSGIQSAQSKHSEQSPNAKNVNRVINFAITVALCIMAIQWLRSNVSILGQAHTEVKPESIHVSFNDVRGIEEAKDDLKEVVSYLHNPDKYEALGARLPRGVLLVGPPGTGKTLIARAIAGEAGVPFFHASGSEFDEMLVGQGARRVRDLFAAAKARAPCVVFIDEIDSVGAKRVTSNLHPYANQTVNQLLTEMDGFEANDGVVVIGATNRRNDLDRALLRPGRFDVEVTIPRPDLVGRRDIFNLYLDKIVCSKDVDVEPLAKGTVGFTGAEIENVVNQAALRAASDGFDCVHAEHLEQARDRILMGRERKSGRLPDEVANKLTAYHEAGHTLVAYYTKYAHPLHKCTILPRGQSLGHTAQMTDKDEFYVSRAQLLAQMDVAMGGRVAEELIFGPEHITTGAASDIQVATEIAMQMVKSFGMSEKVGLRDLVNHNGDAMIVTNDLSPQMQDLVDSEIKRLLQESYDRARDVLKTHGREHHRLADALLQHETLDAAEIEKVLSGSDLPNRVAKQKVGGQERRALSTGANKTKPKLPAAPTPVAT